MASRASSSYVISLMIRCESELLSGMEDCYDVTPVTLTLEIVGQGDVEINTVDITPSDEVHLVVFISRSFR